MNLLSLIIVFLAFLICGAIAFIAWELTDLAGKDDTQRPPPGEDRRDPSDRAG